MVLQIIFLLKMILVKNFINSYKYIYYYLYIISKDFNSIFILLVFFIIYFSFDKKDFFFLVRYKVENYILEMNYLHFLFNFFFFTL